MDNEELLERLRETIAEAVGEAVKLAVSTNVNRGVCAGSVTYTVKPTRTASEYEALRLVHDAYAANGVALDLETPEGARMFFRVFLEAVKSIVSENQRVNIVDRLVYEPRCYSDGRGAHMQPIASSAEFNRLPCEVALDKSPSFLGRQKARARREPYDAGTKAKPARVGRRTTVTCPKCGFEIPIEDTERE